MNPIEKIIKERRTVHHYLPEKIPDDLVIEVLKTAYFAPNHKLTYPVRFYLLGAQARNEIVNISVKIRKEKGSEITDTLLEEIKAKLLNPSHLVIVSRKNSEDPIRAKEDYATIACTIHNISLLLWPHGIGAKWSTGDIIRRNETYDLLKIDPKEETLEGLVWMGIPKIIKSPPKLPDFDSIFRSL